MGPLRPLMPGQNPYQQAQSAPPGNQASQIVQGIGAFLNNFRAGREAEKERNKKDFLQDAQLLMMGIPVDQKKMAKKAKAAGMDLDFEGPTPEQQAIQQRNLQTANQAGPGIAQGVQNQATQATLAHMGQQQGGTPGLSQMPNTLAGMGPVQGPQMQPMPPRPELGLGQRMMMGLGFDRRPIDLKNSSGGQWLQSLADQGQQNAAMQKESGEQNVIQMQHKRTMLGVLTKALQGDPQAQEMAYRFGGMQMAPYDGIMRLGESAGVPREETAKNLMFNLMGGPAALQSMRSMAEKMSDRFGGDMGKSMKYVQDVFAQGRSDLKPGMTPDEQGKIMEQADKLLNRYPTLPANYAMTYSLLQFHGQTKEAQELLGYVSKNGKREGQIQQEQFDINKEYQRDALKQAAWIHTENLNMSRQRAVVDALGDQGRMWYTILNNKEASEETRKSALSGMATALNGMNDLKMTFQGADGKMKTVPLGVGNLTAEHLDRWWPRSDEFNLKFTSPGSGLDQFVGMQPGKKSDMSLGDMIKHVRRSVETSWLDFPVVHEDQ